MAVGDWKYKNPYENKSLQAGPSTPHNGADWKHQECQRSGNWPKDFGELADIYAEVLPWRDVWIILLRLLHEKHTVTFNEVAKAVEQEAGRKHPGDVHRIAKRINSDRIHWNVPFKIKYTGMTFELVPISTL